MSGHDFPSRRHRSKQLEEFIAEYSVDRTFVRGGLSTNFTLLKNKICKTSTQRWTTAGVQYLQWRDGQLFLFFNCQRWIWEEGLMRTISYLSMCLATLLSTPLQAITIDTVPVGNPSNPHDTRYIDGTHPSGVGSVAYHYAIGATEVTNAQYVAFLNAVAASDPYSLYSTSMSSDTKAGIVRSGVSGSYEYAVKLPAIGQGPGGSDYVYDDKPVVHVSSGDAMRFANWLHNGQGGPATTEDGAYTLAGAVSFLALAAVNRNPGAVWFLPSENEWHKAAYHYNDGATGNYWEHPTGTNSMPNNNLPSSDTGNSINFVDSNYTTGNGNYPMTDAGAYTQSGSPYDTFDQGGNVSEWTETRSFDFYRIARGGSFANGYNFGLRASYWFSVAPHDEHDDIGFRVASIPEPSTVSLAVFGAMVLLSRFRHT
jgi:formylglycine-generating enzyme required for sulfatase activity